MMRQGDVMENMQTKEIISALADGQLQGDAFARGVEVAARDPLGLEAWQTYHLIGDVLRSGELAMGSTSAEFLSGLQARLQQEQLPLHILQQRIDSPGTAMRIAVSRPAANDADSNWKLLAGFASLAVMAGIGWTVAGGFVGKQEQAARAQAGAVLAGMESGMMIHDARLDEFLAAHRQLGGASALPVPAGALRNASFYGPGR
jgi:sigma-E factor negative regulatory protein RseA